MTEYNITPEGTPVSEHDAEALLAMTEEPCCGESLPFGGMVKSFGVHIPTAGQLEQVPLWLFDLEPVVPVKTRGRRRRKAKKYDGPTEVVVEEPKEESQEEEPVPYMAQEEETSEEVS
jgi:hypothetical protein